MKNFKQVLTEAKAKKKESQENIEGGDITKPYRTPQDILDIMNRNTGDDSAYDWSENNPADDQGRRRGAESVGPSTEDITPGMAAERARSSSILSGVQGLPIRSSEEAVGTSVPGRQYSNQEIATIMNARGIKTLRGKNWTHQLVDQVAQKALEQLRLNNDLNSLMPKPSSNLGTSSDH